MATTNAWGVPAAGAWADDEPEEEPAPAPTQYVNPAARAAAAHTDFPSLGEAVKQAAAPKSKKKGTKVALGDFLGNAPKPAFSRRNDDKDILAQLPKAPQGADRPESEQAGIGGGFRDYGGNRYAGGAGGFAGRDERDGRDGPRRREDGEGGFGDSGRADDVDDWGTTKKFEPSGRGSGTGGGFGGADRPRGGGFSDRPVGASDTADDWGSNKQFQPSERSAGGGGGGFRDRPGFGGDRDRDRPGGFGDRPAFEPSRADQEDEWSRGRQFTPAEPGGARSGRSFGFGDRAAADEGDRWERKGPSAGDAAPTAPAGERPRLKLAPRTKPVEQVALAPGAPAPAAGSVDPGKAKSNPFGAARPREEVLKAKGIDPSQAEPDKQAGPVEREEAPEEVALKGEVEQLRKQLEIIKASGPDPESIADEVASAEEELGSKEKELVKLAAELDKKARAAKAEADAAAPVEAAAAHEADDGSWNQAARAPREARGALREAPKEPRKERAPSAEGAPAAAPFAGAPGKDRW